MSPRLIGDVEKVTVGPGSRITNQYIQFLIDTERLRNHIGTLLHVGEVGADCHGICSEFFYAFGRRIQAIL